MRFAVSSRCAHPTHKNIWISFCRTRRLVRRWVRAFRGAGSCCFCAPKPFLCSSPLHWNGHENKCRVCKGLLTSFWRADWWKILPNRALCYFHPPRLSGFLKEFSCVFLPPPAEWSGARSSGVRWADLSSRLTYLQTGTNSSWSTREASKVTALAYTCISRCVEHHLRDNFTLGLYDILLYCP